MEAFGQALGQACLSGSVIYLQGTLGMGKTTLSRSIVQGLGWKDRVKSPTYTLVEQYPLAEVEVLHFDLYRLADPEELEFMGIRDFDPAASIWLIEWPEKGSGALPPPDLEIYFQDAPEARELELVAVSDKSESQLQQLAQKWSA